MHENSGYPSRWPDDPGRWLTPARLVGAWVAEANGRTTGHVALVQGVRVQCLLEATGRAPDELGTGETAFKRRAGHSKGRPVQC